MRTGVVLMTYGSPRDLDDVASYLQKIRGREPSPELTDEFRRRYGRIGGRSPLVEITQALAAELDRSLGEPWRVRAGMRFSEPTIAGAIDELVEAGAGSILGLVLSPQYSPLIMDGYARALDSACTARDIPHWLVGDWHLEPAFVQVIADRVQAGLRQFPAETRASVPVLLTAHSLPKRVVDQEPGYVAALQETATAIAQAAGLQRDRWSFVYQSAGHTPEEWLKPDLLDVLPELAASGSRAVLVAPVQFLADHLETLYDIDVAGREQAEAAGIEQFARVPAPNADPDLADALAAIVRRESRVPAEAAAA